MDCHIQTASLIECPSYPNSVAWSEENLVAVASGSAITLLNPAQISGPRGLIKLAPNRPFSIGVVKEEDVCAPCLLHLSLSRDTRPCARSISWSPLGFTPSSGCMLAVCTTDGLVKLYCAPYCEYRTEWVEVVDISKALSDYLDRINFGEACKSHGNPEKDHVEEASAANGKNDIDSQNSYEINGVKKKRFKAPSLREGKYFESKTEKGLPVITSEQYASRIAMLSSLVVAWSSVLSLSFESCSCIKYAVLAVGGKSGKISFWRFRHPEYYNIEHGKVSIDAQMLGLLQAHDGWVNTISWGVLNVDPLKPQLLLATGCSDGSVKLWIMDCKQLLISSDANFIPIQLLKEVISVTHIPISTLSIANLMKSPDSFVLAVGKGSGSLEVWACHLSSSIFDKLGAYSAHDQVVTGLSWGFDGCHLYSCSQDGSIYSWDLCMDLQKDLLSNPVKLNEPLEVAHLSDPCFGLVLSPGNLMVAVVRSFDVDLLNPMYQARTQRAAVEFLWACPQPVNPSLEKETILSWRANILWSLNHFLNPERPLVLWDILFALKIFKQNDPRFMKSVLVDWLSGFCFSDLSMDTISLEEIPTPIKILFPEFSIRTIHMLNIISRHLILPEIFIPDKAEEKNLWQDLLVYSENMLRIRLVAFSFQAAIFGTSKNSGIWSPVGLAQLKQWIFMNKHLVDDRLVVISSQIDGTSSRINSTFEYREEESCSFCSSPVPFGSPESAVCRPANGSQIGHKLTRCAVSMKLCSVSSLRWFCICCQRCTSHLLPGSFYTCVDLEVDCSIDHEFSPFVDQLKPICPFCGILLQRYMPNFLLSVNPV